MIDETCIGTLRNQNLYPSRYDYIHVVAKTHGTVRNEGFGVMYKTDCTYFPHENMVGQKQIGSGEV